MNVLAFIFGILLIFSVSIGELIFAQTDDCRSMGELQICNPFGRSAFEATVEKKMISNNDLSAEQRKIINNFIKNEIASLQTTVVPDVGLSSESQKVLNSAANYKEHWNNALNDFVNSRASESIEPDSSSFSRASSYDQYSWNSRSTNTHVVPNNPSNLIDNFEINVDPITLERKPLSDTTLKINNVDALISQNNNYKISPSSAIPTTSAKFDGIGYATNHDIRNTPLPPITNYVDP